MRVAAGLGPLELSTLVLVESSPHSPEEMTMHVRVLLEITANDSAAGAVEEVAAFEKTAERAEDLGLSITEARALLKAVQTHTVTMQVAEWSERHRRCEACGQPRRIKGSNLIVFRTLYGDITLRSP